MVNRLYRHGHRLVLAMLFSVATSVSATTVHDPVNFLINVLNQMENRLTAMQARVTNHQLAVQIKNQLDMVKKLHDEYVKLTEVHDALSGRHGYGQYLEGPFVMLDPNHSPETLDDVLYHMRDVGQASDDSDFGRHAQSYSRLNPYADLGNWKPQSPSAPTRRELDHQKESSLALGAASRQAYSQTSNHFKNLQLLQREMDKTDTVKQALDLNNRILLEIVAAQAEQLRLMAIQTDSMAQQRQQHYNQTVRDLKSETSYQPTTWKLKE